MKHPKGFSLVELMIVIALMGIIATIGSFSWNKYTTNANLRAAARDVASDFFVTREKAVSESVRYRITFDVTNNNYTIERGTITGSPYTVIETKTPASLARDITLQSANFGGAVSFQARGTVDAGNVVLSNSRGSTAKITVNMTGRTYVEFTTQ